MLSIHNSASLPMAANLVNCPERFLYFVICEFRIFCFPFCCVIVIAVKDIVLDECWGKLHFLLWCYAVQRPYLLLWRWCVCTLSRLLDVLEKYCLMITIDGTFEFGSLRRLKSVGWFTIAKSLNWKRSRDLPRPSI